ncbi:uncharacterized protein LY89DRAFT_50397 [Mollisia scopiformis]|uniref:Uncharacterized protein n=1 Tax=Mollisia scopiformis TaxID=149040 RepID=A0A194XAW3_MOLSC|nr:uncharacterized protein LY89DRAFT_50397 [Mollisia scopiformis]KUJ17305.1 hypothetical protein LY89DRAFT_50397 [Mollisia scopiformis]
MNVTSQAESVKIRSLARFPSRKTEEAATVQYSTQRPARVMLIIHHHVLISHSLFSHHAQRGRGGGTISFTQISVYSYWAAATVRACVQRGHAILGILCILCRLHLHLHLQAACRWLPWEMTRDNYRMLANGTRPREIRKASPATGVGALVCILILRERK